MIVRTQLTILIAIIALAVTVTPGLAGTISGKVVPPVAGVEIWVWDQAKGLMLVVTTDKHGGFKFDRLDPGEYQPMVHNPLYLCSATAKSVRLGRNSVSGGNVIRLVRAGALKGRTVPDRVTVDGSAKSRGFEIVSKNGAYATEEGLPAGTCSVTARAKGYATLDRTVKISAGRTTTLDLRLQKVRCISGRLSPAPLEGIVVAKRRSDNVPVEAADIEKDGSYSIAGVAPGTYDLVIVAKGFERVVGFGPMPVPDTLTAPERQAIRDVYADYDHAVAAKDLDALMSHFSKSFKAEAMDYSSLKKQYADMIAISEALSIEHTLDCIAGSTGKTAKVVTRYRMKATFKEAEKSVSSDDTGDSVTNLAFESGKWLVTGAENSPSYPYASFLGLCPRIATDNWGWFVGPLKGETSSMTWRYSDDPGMAGIVVSPGKDSMGHAFALTPAAK